MSDPAYDKAWEARHQAVRLLRMAETLWLVPIGVFAVGIVGFELIPNTLDWRGPLWRVFVLLLAAVLGFRMFAGLKLKRVKCPRCTKPFVRLSILQIGLLSTMERRPPCQHCNLPVGAASAEVVQDGVT
jgi:hypothetical protein